MARAEMLTKRTRTRKKGEEEEGRRRSSTEILAGLNQPAETDARQKPQRSAGASSRQNISFHQTTDKKSREEEEVRAVKDSVPFPADCLSACLTTVPCRISSILFDYFFPLVSSISHLSTSSF